MWNVDLSGHSGDHKIVTVAAKNPIERVHSLGRVMPDRSVLYKYINPNLVAVFTQAADSIHKRRLYFKTLFKKQTKEKKKKHLQIIFI